MDRVLTFAVRIAKTTHLLFFSHVTTFPQKPICKDQ